MDGPLFPDYQTRDVLLDLKPYIDKDGYDLSQLADQGVADFTTADGGQYGLPRDLNTVVLYYNKAMFDAAGLPYPDDTWDWAKLVEVGKQLTLTRTATGRPTSGASTPRPPTWRTTGLARVAERRRHHGRRRQVHGRRQPRGGGRDPVPPGPDLQGQDHAPNRASAASTGRRLRAGPARWRINGSWLVPTHAAAGLDFGIAPLPAGPGRDASRRSTRPASSSTRGPSRPTRPGSS